MIAATEDDMDEHVASAVLSGIKEKLEVTDLINQLDIADGLKELLLSSNFTLESLLNASVSDLAKTLQELSFSQDLTCAIFSLDMMDKRCVVTLVDY